MATLDHKISLSVPFNDNRLATIALKSIEPDPELKPDQFTRNLQVEDNNLKVEFAAATDRNLRVGVNSFMDSLNLVVECIDELDPTTNHDL